MSVVNFLRNSEGFSISQARDIITQEALGRNTLGTIQTFERHYDQIMKDYYSDGRLKLSSISFQLDKLESFKPWLDELTRPENIQLYMPFIISKMLDKDPLAHSIFKMIYKTTGKSDVLFSPTTFTNHPELKEALAHSDADVNTRATVNAIHWINSDEGREVLCAGVVYKNSIESLIGTEC